MELKLEMVSKNYKRKRAVNELSHTFTEGVWGILGPNGAGKTTLIKMLCGLLRPTSGVISLDNIPIKQLNENFRNILGYLPQHFGYFIEFTVLDYLMYMSALKGINPKDTSENIDKVVNILSLECVINQKIHKLSGGTKRRVGIAQSLLNDPKVLIFDEPTAGLDPKERNHFRNTISTLSKNKIILVSTHIVSDIEYIATDNIILNEGQLVASGTKEKLAQPIEDMVWQTIIKERFLANLEKDCFIVNLRREKEDKVWLRYIAKEPWSQDCEKQIPRLEDVYLWLSNLDMQGGDIK